MKKFGTILLGGAILLGLTLIAPAERGQHQRGNPLERLQSKLNLSPEQVEQLKPTFESMQQRHQAQREKMKAQFASILTPEQRAKMESDKGSGKGHRGHFKDLNLTDAQKAQMKSFWESQRGQMKQDRTAIDSQMEATLTPEQLTKYQEMKSHWGKRHHHGGEGRRGE